MGRPRIISNELLKPFTFSLDKECDDYVNRLAVERDESRSEILRQIIKGDNEYTRR